MERLLSSLCCCSLMGLTLTATCLQLCCCLLVSGSAADDYSGALTHIERVAFINLSYVDPATGEWRTERIAGLYGSESRRDDEWGVVVHVRALDNQTDGCRPPVNAPSDRWIALIRRGACKFHQKIQNAGIISNASAVVIYNNLEDTQLLTMKHKVDDVVSVFVKKQDGDHIASLVDNGTRIVMHIVVGPTRPSHAGSVNRTSVLFVSISFIVLMVISLAWLVFYYIQRFRYAHTKDRLAKRLTTAAKKAVSKMPQKTVRRGDAETEPDFDLCAICVEGYKAGDVLRVLPCKHLFHKLCIDPWLIEQRSCPICKLDILQAYGLHVSSVKDSVSTDTETPFIFADVTDYLLDVGDIRDIHVVAESSVRPTSSASTRQNSELAVVTDPLTTQRMSQLSDD